MRTLPSATFPLLVLLSAACGDSPEIKREAESPGVEAPSLSAIVQSTKRLSQIPHPRDPRAFSALLDAHYPPDLRSAGRVGAVLMDVTIDDRGSVNRAIVVDRPSVPPRVQIRAVSYVTDRNGSIREAELPTYYDPAFGPAARAALLATEFVPAMRNGEAVPHTMRMTVRFGERRS